MSSAPVFDRFFYGGQVTTLVLTNLTYRPIPTPSETAFQTRITYLTFMQPYKAESHCLSLTVPPAVGTEGLGNGSGM